MQQPISQNKLATHEIQTQHHTANINNKHEIQQQTSEELSYLLTQLALRFETQATADDLNMLSFSLRYLFERINELYMHVLPGLAALPSATSPSTNDPPSYHHTWYQLEQLQRTLTRLETLAHTLNESVTGILDTLDATTHARPEHTQPYLYHQSHAADTLCTEDTLRTLNIFVHRWQQTYCEYHPFSSRFATLLPSIPHLPEIDEALNILLKSVHTIYNGILHDLLIGSHTTIETAVLLLDLLQQGDLLLSSLDICMEPLHTMMKYVALAAEMY